MFHVRLDQAKFTSDHVMSNAQTHILVGPPAWYRSLLFLLLSPLSSWYFLIMSLMDSNSRIPSSMCQLGRPWISACLFWAHFRMNGLSCNWERVLSTNFFEAAAAWSVRRRWTAVEICSSQFIKGGTGRCPVQWMMVLRADMDVSAITCTSSTAAQWPKLESSQRRVGNKSNEWTMN